MKTNSKALASFLAAAVWADGEYCEFEKSLVADMGDLLDVKTLTQDLEVAIAATENMSGDELTAHLEVRPVFPIFWIEGEATPKRSIRFLRTLKEFATAASASSLITLMTSSSVLSGLMRSRIS